MLVGHITYIVTLSHEHFFTPLARLDIDILIGPYPGFASPSASSRRQHQGTQSNTQPKARSTVWFRRFKELGKQGGDQSGLFEEATNTNIVVVGDWFGSKSEVPARGNKLFRKMVPPHLTDMNSSTYMHQAAVAALLYCIPTVVD